MISLLAVELQRSFARRLVHVLTLVALGAIATTMVLLMARVPALTRADERQALEQLATVAETCEARADIDQCPTHLHPGDFVVPNRAFLTDFWKGGGRDGVLSFTTVLLSIGGLLIGASIIGADWKAHTFVTQLTWEPRRLRLTAAKLAAVFMGAATMAILLQALLTVGSALVLSTKSTTLGADAAWWREWAGALLRSGLLVGLVATGAAAVAMVGRSTAAAIWITFGYFIVFESIVRAWKPWTRRWMLVENAATLLLGGPYGRAHARSLTGAVVVLLVGVGLLVAAAGVTFARRDVAAAS